MYPIKLFVRSRFVQVLAALLAVEVFGSWWYVLANVSQNVDQFFLHYNIIFGVDLAGSKWKLMLLPSSVSLVALLNIIIAWIIYGNYRVLSKILLAAGVLACAVGFYAVMIIVGLNA